MQNSITLATLGLTIGLIGYMIAHGMRPSIHRTTCLLLNGAAVALNLGVILVG